MERGKIHEFLVAIDDKLAVDVPGQRLTLHLLGRSALIVAFNANIMTNDIDIVYEHGSVLQQIALDGFGKGTGGHARHGLYLEPVAPGLPPLPSGYQQRCVEIPGLWKAIAPMMPEGHDLIVTKLKRFGQRDREDIGIICDKGRIAPETLRQRLDSAFPFREKDDDDYKSTVANLERVVAYLNGESRGI